MELSNRKVLLTGATGGIGTAVAEALAHKGANLLLTGRDEEALTALSDKIPGKHQIIVADINSTEGREAITQRCIQGEGIDVLINLAGVLTFQFFEYQTEASIEQVLQTNLISPMLLCNKLIPHLKTQKEAAIVNVGSIFGSIGHPAFTTYCASKFGLRGFTEALRRELADTTIKVFYLAPRATATDLNSSAVTSLNDALGNKTDAPSWVASELIRLLNSDKHQRYLGWPEKLYVHINALFPSLVHNALVKKIPAIRRFSEQPISNDL
jgi:short-subunit dehydrogenase